MAKKFIKSIAVTLAVCTMLSATLIGCGKEQESVSTSTELAVKTEATKTEEAPKEVDLRIINYRVEDQAFFDKFHEMFKQEYPYITVKYDAIPTADYPTLLAARLAANETDLFGTHAADIKEEGTRARMADLSGQKFLENYNQDVVKMCQYDGKTLMIPSNNVSMVAFYNKNMFKDNGLSVPSTWSEFVNVCETFKSKGIDPIIFGGKDQWPVNMVVGALEAGIVRPVDPDFYTNVRTEKSKYTDKTWLEVLQKLKITMSYFQKDSSGLGYAQAPGLFAQGKAAMTIDGSWSASQIVDAKPAFEVGAFLLPGSDNAENNKIANMKIGGGFSMVKDTPVEDAALKYLEFISKKENYEMYIDMVKMGPVQNDITLKDPLAQEIANLMNKQQLLHEEILIPGQKFDLTNYAMQLLMGKITPEKVVENLQKDLIDSKETWK